MSQPSSKQQHPFLDSILAEKYQIIRNIGTGAHGEVFTAKVIKDNSLVAIKIFYAHLEQQILQYIFKELKTIESLSHPNILKVLAFGRGKCGECMVHYLVTPFMQGGSLAEVIQKKQKIGIGESANIAVQIAKALAYMHGNRFIHRDVKPQNILGDKLLRSFVLADFGIVCEADTQQTRIVGTMEYCAPEQMENSQKADFRMDIYGLGMTLYEMLSGTNPYRQIAQKQGEAAAIRCKYTNEFPLVSIYNRDIPQELSQIVRKMIANSPQERYSNMQEVIHVLKPYAIVRDSRVGTGTGTESPKLPANLDPIFNYAKQLRRAQKWEEALEKYNLVLQQSPYCSQAYFGKGMVYMQVCEYKDAIVNFNLAIQYRPNSYSAYCQRSIAHLELKDFQNALLDITRAIDLQPQRSEAYFYRANLYRHLFKYYSDLQRNEQAQKANEHIQKDLARYHELKNAGT